MYSKSLVHPRIAGAGLLLVALLLAGCGSGRTVGVSSTSPGSAELSLDRDLQPLLTSRCATAGCHGGAGAQRDLDLSRGQAWSHLVNVESVSVPGKLRVKPGDHANSFFYEKLSQDEPSDGVRMPSGAQPLSDAELKLVADWIDKGAKP